MSQSAVNSQILDSVAATNTLLAGQAPAGAQAMVDLASAQALGVLLHSAVDRYQQSAISGAAAATATCARILAARQTVATGSATPPAPPPPIKPIPEKG